MHLGKITVVLLGMACMAGAASNPFTGKWKLNVEKSKFNPGPAMQSESVLIAEDGKVTMEGKDPTGKPIAWSYAGTEGQKAEITGMGPNSSVVGKMKGNTIQHTWRMAGNASTGKGVLSKDGKTMTYRIKGTNVEGKPMNDVMIFEREQ